MFAPLVVIALALTFEMFGPEPDPPVPPPAVKRSEYTFVSMEFATTKTPNAGEYANRP
jgi:hypothetical protein